MSRARSSKGKYGVMAWLARAGTTIASTKARIRVKAKALVAKPVVEEVKKIWRVKRTNGR